MSVVFVFGSNTAGRHGKGAALEAVRLWGAQRGRGAGRQGNSYAIPTKGATLETLPLWQIADGVNEFIAHARANPNESFLVTAIGCGLAGYQPRDIAPMFAGAPENVFLSAKLAEGLRAPPPVISVVHDIEPRSPVVAVMDGGRCRNCGAPR